MPWAPCRCCGRRRRRGHGRWFPLPPSLVLATLCHPPWYKRSRPRPRSSVLASTERSKALEAVTGHLLRDESERVASATLLNIDVEALGENGKSEEALALATKPSAEFAKLPTQLATLKLSAATVYHRQLKDFTEAS